LAWVVDTSVLLDVLLDDPGFAQLSAECLSRHLLDGLVICPVTYMELAPAFNGSTHLEEAFLEQVGIDWFQGWTWTDIRTAHQLWDNHVKQKRAAKERKRPVADLLIEAFAHRFEGVISRNRNDFSSVLVITP
jgi:predicted nucleic acid-binding protein